MLCPAPAADWTALKTTAKPTVGCAGENTKAADGAADCATTTGFVVAAVAPRLVVTISVTLYEFGSRYVWLGVAPVPVPPSPKLQEYVAMGSPPEHAPFVSGPPQLDVASNSVGVFVTGEPVVTLNAATGVCAGGRITPAGTRVMEVCTGCVVCASFDTSVATIDTAVMVESLGGGAGAGAVYTAVAVPSLPVTI